MAMTSKFYVIRNIKLPYDCNARLTLCEISFISRNWCGRHTAPRLSTSRIFCAVKMSQLKVVSHPRTRDLRFLRKRQGFPQRVQLMSSSAGPPNNEDRYPHGHRRRSFNLTVLLVRSPMAWPSQSLLSTSWLMTRVATNMVVLDAPLPTITTKHVAADSVYRRLPTFLTIL